ncbi:hypothetical protein U1Q18_001260, partial [Sarracenia purpurea var. burkii]
VQVQVVGGFQVIGGDFPIKVVSQPLFVNDGLQRGQAGDWSCSGFACFRLIDASRFPTLANPFSVSNSGAIKAKSREDDGGAVFGTISDRSISRSISDLLGSRRRWLFGFNRRSARSERRDPVKKEAVLSSLEGLANRGGEAAEGAEAKARGDWGALIGRRNLTKRTEVVVEALCLAK